MASYQVRQKGQIRGPFTSERMLQFIAEGKLKPTHEVSSDGVHWVLAGTVAELFAPTQQDDDQDMVLELDDGPPKAPPPPPGSRPAQPVPTQAPQPNAGAPFVTGGAPYTGHNYEQSNSVHIMHWVNIALALIGFALMTISPYLSWYLGIPGRWFLLLGSSVGRGSEWFAPGVAICGVLIGICSLLALYEVWLLIRSLDALTNRKLGALCGAAASLLFLSWFMMSGGELGDLDFGFWLLPIGTILTAIAWRLEPGATNSR